MTGRELRRARKRLGMTQKQLAEALGIAKNTVARQERGELDISKVESMAVSFLLVRNPNKRRKR